MKWDRIVSGMARAIHAAVAFLVDSEQSFFY